MKKIIFTYCTFLFLMSNSIVFAQKIDVDSLLIKLIKETKEEKNPQEIIQKAKIGTAVAPDYLDYYLVIGRNFERIPKIDSAQFYYKKVISKSENYPEAYNYLINSEISNQQYDSALQNIEIAKKIYPSEKEYYNIKKLSVFELQNNEEEQLQFMESLLHENPKNTAIKDRYILLTRKLKSDRIGFQYANTTFNRDNYGPWNQFMLQYIRSRKWGTLIGNINSMNRKSTLQTDKNGTQFEVASYIFTSKKNYINLSTAFSNNEVYPKFRFGATYYISFLKNWEADFGTRYTKTQTSNLTALVLGFGGYFKSFWFNFSSFIQGDNNDINPAFSGTSRYYFDTRYDYFYTLLGYGTSPDENNTSGLYERRVNLNSYRIGAGISKQFYNHYILGLQFLYNNQEYFADKYQNEYEVTLSFQYKF